MVVSFLSEHLGACIGIVAMIISTIVFVVDEEPIYTAEGFIRSAICLGGYFMIVVFDLGLDGRKYVVLAVVAFFFPTIVLGIINFLGSRTYRQNVRKEKQEHKAFVNGKNKAHNAILNGRKYKAFQAFINEHKDSIGAIKPVLLGNDYRTEVYCAPDGVPMMVKIEDEYEEKIDWNPDLGSPVKYSYGAKYEWMIKRFFTIEKGERNWTSEETAAIHEIISNSLPSGGTKWKAIYPDHNYYYSGKEYPDYYVRDLPKITKKKDKKDPY